MIIATKICMLILSCLFYFSAMGAKTEKQCYINAGIGTVLVVLLLVALKLL